MSSMFGSLAISGSGMNVYRTWLDAIADNVANINTVRPTDQSAFQERMVVAQSVGSENGGIGGGAQVAGIVMGDSTGQLVYDPENAMADANGMVRRPSMDLSDQMSHLIVAQRSYQLNVSVFERARDAYQKALEIGQ